MGFFGFLFLVLLVLKLVGVIGIGWGLLFGILLIPVLIYFVMMVIVTLITK